MLAPYSEELDWVQHLPQIDSVEALKRVVAERLAEAPIAFPSLPEIVLLEIDAPLQYERLKRALPAQHINFFVRPPAEGFDGALVPSRDGWVLYAPRTTESIHCRLFLRACLHVWLGHMRPDEGFALWIRADGHRRWDNEVSRYLPDAYANPIPTSVWAAAKFLHYLPWASTASPVAASLLSLTPTEHQRRTTQHLVTNFPERFVICEPAQDDSILQVGLAIRDLRLRRLARRILIVAQPSAALLWQRRLRDCFGLELEVEPRAVDAEPSDGVITEFAGSGKLEIATDLDPWDLLIVDTREIHTGRDFVGELSTRSRGVWLLADSGSRTDIEQHFRNLEVCGLRGEFADVQKFRMFFELLTAEATFETFRVLSSFAKSYSHEYGGCNDGDTPVADDVWRRHFGHALPNTKLKFLTSPTKDAFDKLTAEQIAALREILLRQTPVQNHVIWNVDSETKAGKATHGQYLPKEIFLQRSNPQEVSTPERDDSVTPDSISELFVRAGLFQSSAENPHLLHQPDGLLFTFHPQHTREPATLVSYGSARFEKYLSNLLDQPVKSTMGVCAEEARSGPFVSGRIRQYRDGRWETLKSLKDCLGLPRDLCDDDGLPQARKPKIALENQLANYAGRERKLASVLLGAQQAKAANLLIQGLTISQCLPPKENCGRPVGYLGTLIAEGKLLLSEPALKQLSDIVGNTKNTKLELSRRVGKLGRSKQKPGCPDIAQLRSIRPISRLQSKVRSFGQESDKEYRSQAVNPPGKVRVPFPNSTESCSPSPAVAERSRKRRS